MWQVRGNLKSLILFFVLFVGTEVSGQALINSPLSRFGFGDLNEKEFIATYTMGGIGAAYHHPYVTNLVNPASLSYLDAASFEIGLGAKVSWLEKSGATDQVWSGNIQYLSISIPFMNPINEILEKKDRSWRGGFNVSLSPYSQVGYVVNSIGNVDSLGVVRSNFLGRGGTTRFNFGMGWRWKNIAFGFNVGYLFGNLEYQSETIFEQLDFNYDHIGRRTYSINGFLYDLGVMYTVPMSNSKRNNPRSVTFGGHFNTKTRWTGKEDYLNMVVNPTFNDADTAVYTVDGQVDGTLPGQFGIGVMFEEKAKWRGGVTYTRATWSQYENSARPEVLSNTWKLSAGGSFTPDYSSITSYLARVEYRLGAFYQTDPRSLAGTQVRNYGVTIGAGLPFIQQRFFSFIDIAIEYGWRGVENDLNEDYMRFKVGLNLNDTQWFLKRRYN